jgi:hypothetical protein
VAADSELWMIIWWTTLAAMIAAIVIGVVYTILASRDRRRAKTVPQPIEGICFYLHAEAVMNLYLQGNNKGLEQEIEETSQSDTEGGVSAKIPGAGGRAARKAVQGKITRYINKVTPIGVIPVIVDDLENGHRIVYVDLINNSIESGSALDRALRASRGRDAARLRSARLRDLDSFVSVRGRFRETAKTDETITFSAPYGDPADPVGAPRITVTCANTGLHDRAPKTPFPARCLGRVQGWDPNTQELVIDPIAIFR